MLTLEQVLILFFTIIIIIVIIIIIIIHMCKHHILAIRHSPLKGETFFFSFLKNHFKNDLESSLILFLFL